MLLHGIPAIVLAGYGTGTIVRSCLARPVPPTRQILFYPTGADGHWVTFPVYAFPLCMAPSAQIPFRRFRETPIFSDKRLQLLVVLHPFPLEVLIPDKADLIQSPDALFAQTSILPSFPLGITPGRKRAVFTFGPASAGIKEDFQCMVFPHPFGVELIPLKPIASSWSHRSLARQPRL